MAENQDGQEKTEQPTGRRLQQAREKGQVPRSKELDTTVVLLVSAGSLLLLGGRLGRNLVDLMQSCLLLNRHAAFDSGVVTKMLGEKLLAALGAVAPFLLIALVAVLMTPALMGGWSFSAEKLALDLNKLNPVQGVKKIVSAQGLVELLKSLAKVTLIGGVAALLIWHLSDDLMGLGNLDIRSAIARSFHIVGWTLFGLSSVMILIAAVDVPFQLWNHKRELRMTKQEVKDDSKETEGNPETKGRVRRVQQEMAMRRMMEEVPKADVIVTNPTHFAVALKYDDKAMGAPRVVAKGADMVAMRIRTLARQNRVPVFEAPPLARALYFSTELNREIPAGLYLAVAQVLAYVYQLRRSIYGDAEAPPPPSDLDVPDEFLRGF
ncbi:MAG: flagellar biosynthesis protein FlhB [Gammaproteobacteria bacterium]